jgi:hypothetical protein
MARRPRSAKIMGHNTRGSQESRQRYHAPETPNDKGRHRTIPKLKSVRIPIEPLS